MDDQQQKTQAPSAQIPSEQDALSTSATTRPAGVSGAALALVAESPDGSKTTAVRTKFEVVASTIVDLAALGILGAALLLGRVQSEWLQVVCVVGVLLLAGVRVADLVALSKGMPPRGGVGALLIAGLSGAAAWLGARGGDA